MPGARPGAAEHCGEGGLRGNYGGSLPDVSQGLEELELLVVEGIPHLRRFDRGGSPRAEIFSKGTEELPQAP